MAQTAETKSDAGTDAPRILNHLDRAIDRLRAPRGYQGSYTKASLAGPLVTAGETVYRVATERLAAVPQGSITAKMRADLDTALGMIADVLDGAEKLPAYRPDPITVGTIVRVKASKRASYTGRTVPSGFADALLVVVARDGDIASLRFAGHDRVIGVMPSALEAVQVDEGERADLYALCDFEP